MGADLSYPTVDLPPTRTVVVTGGNTGIGYETAKAIAAMGARVIIACRSEDRATKAIERMQQEYQESSATEPQEDRKELQVEFMKLDLNSLKSTMEFIEEFKNTGYPLHVLICNAGIAFVHLGHTEDGNEQHFQVNYLGHLLIILHLLPVMKTSGSDARVVMVASGLYERGKFELDNMDGKSSYNRTQFYCKSKLYQVMSMYALQRRLQGSNVTVTSLEPGFVQTEIFRNSQDSGLVRVFQFAGGLLARSPADGAATTINCAVNPKLAGSGGVYYGNCKPQETKTHARNEKAQEELLQYSLECLTGHVTEDMMREWAGPLQQ